MKKRFGLIIIVMTLVLTTVLATKDVISVKAATTKKDAKVLECQKWLNKTYKGKKGYVVIKEDGIAGGNTTKALIRAVQIQLKVEVDGSFGEGTRVKFPNLSVKTKKCNLSKIMQYALYCKGYNAGTCNGEFHKTTKNAVVLFQRDAGYKGSGVINGYWAQALLSSKEFKLVSGGDVRIRNMQKYLNANYFKYIGIQPCDGIRTPKMQECVIKALQALEGFTPEQANGHFGEGTYSKCPNLRKGHNLKIVVLLRIALEINGFNKQGGLGTLYDDALVAKVKEYQVFMNLPIKTGNADRGTITSLLKTCGDQNRAANAIDTSTKLDADKIIALKEKGYKYIGRYLTKVEGGLDKDITREEAELIVNEGLKIIPIYQVKGDEATCFNANQGTIHARAAYEAAKKIGIPQGSTIYFAVDFDAYGDVIKQNIIPYFQAINKYLKSMETVYNIGIYATRTCCNSVTQSKLAKYSYVRDMSYGCGGNKAVYMPRNWSFDQFAEIKEAEIGIDKVNASGRDAGVSTLDAIEQ